MKVSKFWVLIGSFCAKYITFDIKKYRDVIFHDTEVWCNIWRKTDLWFGEWHEELGKFSQEHLKVSILGHWWDPCVQSRKCTSFVFTEEVCVITMKNDSKFEENWLAVSKLKWGTSWISTKALESFKNLHLVPFTQSI